MRNSKSLYDAVQFANWCDREKVSPGDAADLLSLAKKAHAAGVRACNEPGHSEREKKAGERFEAKAAELGYTVDWPGLWPVLRKNGQDVFLPEIR